MQLRIVRVPSGAELDLSVEISNLTGKMVASYEPGTLVICDGDEEDLRKLAEAGIVLKKTGE